MPFFQHIARDEADNKEIIPFINVLYISSTLMSLFSYYVFYCLRVKTKLYTSQDIFF